MEGDLKKKGGSMFKTKWQTRKFVLETTQITYSEVNLKKGTCVLKGTMFLKGCSATEVTDKGHHPHTFHIEGKTDKHSNGQTLTVRAGSHEEMGRWIETINNAVRSLEAPKSKSPPASVSERKISISERARKSIDESNTSQTKEEAAPEAFGDGSQDWYQYAITGELNDDGDTVPSDTKTEKKVVFYNPIINQLSIQNPFLDEKSESLDQRTTFTLIPANNTEEDQPQKKWRDTETEETKKKDTESLGLRLEAQLQGCLDDLDMLKNIAESKDGKKLVEAVGDIESMLDQVKEWKQTVETSQADEEEDKKTDMEAILGQDDSPWSFHNNQLVDSYRAAAYTRWGDDQKIPLEKWYMPRYFSEQALPTVDLKRIFLTVSLSKSLVEKFPSIAITTKKMRLRGTADDCCAESVAKFSKNISIGDAKSYTLKAAAYHAYMYGERSLMDYEFVRRQIREGKEDIPIVLEEIPDMKAIQNNLVETYKNRSPISTARPFSRNEGERTIGLPDLTQDSPTIDMSAVTGRFQIRVSQLMHAEAFPMAAGCSSLCIKSVVFAGFNASEDSRFTWEADSIDSRIRWDHWNVCRQLQINSLPRTARIGFQVFGVKATEGEKKESKSKKVLLGYVVKNLVNEYGELLTGKQTFTLWPIPPPDNSKHGSKKKPDDPHFLFKLTAGENCWDGETKNLPTLAVEFADFHLPVTAPESYIPWVSSGPEKTRLGGPTAESELTPTKRAILKNLNSADSLHIIQENERALVWQMRHSLTATPRMLPKFFQSVDFFDPAQVNEAHRLLLQWKWNNPAAALELLDCKYHDFKLREWAAAKLDELPDHLLGNYILQLVQCLKYEQYSDSPLSRLLIKRALASPYEIGHYMFWLLKAELHVPQTHERFSLMLEEYLSWAERHVGQLRAQNTACNKLIAISEMIIKLNNNKENERTIRASYEVKLSRFNRNVLGMLDEGLMLPSDPRIRVKRLINSKCRYMSSKMVPLWLCFDNVDPPPDGKKVFIMFKNGDDLRQDMLTLQLLRRMDEMWLSDGLDMRLTPYDVMATGVNDHGDGVGMMMPVLAAETISSIQADFGGGAVGALKLDPILLYIQNTNTNTKYLDMAKDNFVRSCAGYLVATYILGIGDRHNGNIMVTKKGHLFHIDFGHFLGNFKSKFGVNRERTAFVFTPEMAHVMGGQRSNTFKQFVRMCKKGFHTVRANAKELEYLFMLMVPAGMPELLVEPDIYYMRDKLQLDLTDDKAAKALEREISKSLNSRYRRFDNMVHIWKHH